MQGPGIRGGLPNLQKSERYVRLNNATVSAMQMTEDLIRSVVQQVLSQMGNGAAPGNGKPRASGNLGVFATADDAVLAADAAFRAFRTRPLEDRKKAIDCIRKIC